LAQPLTLRSDNGLVFTSKRFTVTVRRYGVKQEFIQPHTPQQNGIPQGFPSVMIERLFRTMKEQCIWLRRFDSLDETKSVIGRGVDWYNHQRPHQALKMKTPAEIYKLAA
jgi:putative transposase